MSESNHFRNICRKVKGWFYWLIGTSMIETVHEIIDGLMTITYISNGLSGIFFDNQ